MNQDLAEFQSLITWFCNQESLPLKSRHDFLDHVLKIGKFDTKAKQFIEDALTHVENKTKKQLHEYQDLVSEIETILHRQNSPQSLKESILSRSENEMLQRATHFKEDYQTFETQQNKNDETQETTQDQATIAALKDTL